MGNLHNKTPTKNESDKMLPSELKFMNLNRMVLHISFTVPTASIAASPVKSTLFYLFTPCVFVLYALVLTAQILGVYHYWGDLDVTMENLFLTTGFVMCFWEGAYFKIKREEIWKIFDRVDSKPVPNVSNLALSDTHKRAVIEAQSNCKKLSWFIFLSVNVGTLMWAVFPIVNLLIHSLTEHDRFEEDSASQKSANKPWPYLMYIIWVPYDVTKMHMYAVTYLIQVIVYFAASLYNTGSNIVFLNMVLHATAKFKVVESSILHMGKMISENADSIKNEIHDNAGKCDCGNGKEYIYAEDRVTSSNSHSRNSTDTADGYLAGPHSSEIEDFLVECIKQHQDAIDFSRELNYVVSNWIAFALLIHQLLLVAEVFQLAMTAASGFSILKHFMSIIGVLSQSLLLCWLGERHIQQSLRVKAAAYNCNWCDQSARFKRLLLMIIVRAQDPVKFSAGSFFDINVETFDHILRRAYSYYAVLRKMKET